MKYFFFLLFLNTEYWTLNTASADPWKSLSHGDKTAQELLEQMKAKQKEAGNHPFYQGIPKESKISSDNLKGQSQKACHSEPAAQMIIQSHDARARVKIDPQKRSPSHRVSADYGESPGGYRW